MNSAQKQEGIKNPNPVDEEEMARRHRVRLKGGYVNPVSEKVKLLRCKAHLEDPSQTERPHLEDPSQNERTHLEDPSQNEHHTWKTQVGTIGITSVEVPRRRRKNNYPEQEGFYRGVSHEGS